MTRGGQQFESAQVYHLNPFHSIHYGSRPEYMRFAFGKSALTRTALSSMTPRPERRTPPRQNAKSQVVTASLFPHELGWIDAERSRCRNGGRGKAQQRHCQYRAAHHYGIPGIRLINDLSQQPCGKDTRQPTTDPAASSTMGRPTAALITCVLRAPNATRMPNSFIRRLTL